MNLGGSARQSARQIIHEKKRYLARHAAGATQAIQVAELSRQGPGSMRRWCGSGVGQLRRLHNKRIPDGSGPCVARVF
jgi:hypothetical protein